MFYIYKISNIIDGKFYFGKATNINDRWAQHKYQSKTGTTPLYKAIRKDGYDQFKIEIINEYINEVECLREERKLIIFNKQHNRENIYNVSDGGEGPSGFRHSQKSLELMSINIKKRWTEQKHPRLGVPVSDETRKKQSIAHTGKKLSEETKQRISSSNKNKILSDLTKSLIGNAHRGKVLSPSMREKVSFSIKEKWKDPIYRAKATNSAIGRKNSIESKLKISGENSKVAKLKLFQVYEIIEKYKTGTFTHRSLAKIYNVSHRQIGYILTGKSWKYSV